MREAPPVSPLSLVRGLWRERSLLFQMTQREVVGRYRGSVMGLAWSFFTPLLMLAVYTYVFSEVFNARWDQVEQQSRADFAMILFSGLIVFSLFSETVSKAPGLILAHASYVKKVIFPLEILPASALLGALFHALVSLLALFLVMLLLGRGVSWTALCLPLVYLPLLAYSLGLAWFLASLGVYLRDVGQAIGVIVALLMFTTPIFYPLSALPEAARFWVSLSPLAFLIEESRKVLLFGFWPDWAGLSAHAILGALCAWLGYAWFQKTRSGFADVL
jgi:lipopolysaccharide transport system permease protein